jgi:hypothetical protein
LALSDAHNAELHNIPAMDLGASVTLDLELAQIDILASVVKTLSKRPLRRVLQMHKVDFSLSDGTAALRKHLRLYLKRLRRGKKLDSPYERKTRRDQELSALRSDWPTLVPTIKKRALVSAFNSAISAESLGTFICGSCSGKTSMKDQKRMRIKDFDLGLLRRPDYDALKHGELDSDSESDNNMDVDTSNDDECGSEDLLGQSSTVVDVMDVDEDVGVNVFGQSSEQACIEAEELEYESDHAAAPLPWLDPNCVPPPLPCDEPRNFDSDGEFEGVLFDPDGIGSDDEGETVLLACTTCSSFLKQGKIPRLSLANYNYLGPVPSELQDLTVIEEAMVARCRAKCWIIQLKEEDDYSTPITQRGVRGHEIVYP